jgi:hypothetical protein
MAHSTMPTRHINCPQSTDVWRHLPDDSADDGRNRSKRGKKGQKRQKFRVFALIVLLLPLAFIIKRRIFQMRPGISPI